MGLRGERYNGGRRAAYTDEGGRLQASFQIGHEADLLAHFQRAVDDPNVRDHSLVVVELGVEDERP